MRGEWNTVEGGGERAREREEEVFHEKLREEEVFHEKLL